MKDEALMKHWGKISFVLFLSMQCAWADDRFSETSCHTLDRMIELNHPTADGRGAPLEMSCEAFHEMGSMIANRTKGPTPMRQVAGATMSTNDRFTAVTVCKSKEDKKDEKDDCFTYAYNDLMLASVPAVTVTQASSVTIRTATLLRTKSESEKLAP